MADLVFKQFSTFPGLTVQLTATVNGVPSQPIDLTNSQFVYMEMEAQGGGTFIASILMASSIATSGIVTHAWAASEVAMADSWNVDWLIIWNASQKQYVPNNSEHTIQIQPAMAPGVP